MKACVLHFLFSTAIVGPQKQLKMKPPPLGLPYLFAEIFHQVSKKIGSAMLSRMSKTKLDSEECIAFGKSMNIFFLMCVMQSVLDRFQSGKNQDWAKSMLKRIPRLHVTLCTPEIPIHPYIVNAKQLNSSVIIVN